MKERVSQGLGLQVAENRFKRTSYKVKCNLCLKIPCRCVKTTKPIKFIELSADDVKNNEDFIVTPARQRFLMHVRVGMVGIENVKPLLEL